MKTFAMEDYKAPRDDLFIDACYKGIPIDGDVIEEYFYLNEPFATGFGEISEDNILRKEIDKYYIIKVPTTTDFIYYRFWSAIDVPSSCEDFPTQEAQKVIKEDGVWKWRI